MKAVVCPPIAVTSPFRQSTWWAVRGMFRSGNRSGCIFTVGHAVFTPLANIDITSVSIHPKITRLLNLSFTLQR